jgi:hypothetical protein
MSDLGVEPKRTGLGSHSCPQNGRRFAAFALSGQKTGQLLVRTSARENVSDFKGKDRLCQEL